jgi:WD40 repeat protein
MNKMLCRTLIAVLSLAVSMAVSAQDVMKRTGHAGEITSVAISPDSKLIASGGKDGTVRIWDAASGKEIVKLSRPIDPDAIPGATYESNSVVFSPNGAYLAAAFDNGITVWETGKWTSPKLELSDGSAGFLIFSPDSTQIATAERKPDYPPIKIPGIDTTPTATIYDIETGESVEDLRGAYGPIAFHPNGKILAFTNEGGGIFCQDLETRETAKGTKLKSDDERVAALTFSRKGDYLYSLAGGGLMSTAGLRTWRTADLQLASKFDIQSNDLILPHPDGVSVVVAGGSFSDSSLSIVNPLTGTALKAFPTDEVNVGTPAAISSDGKFIVAVDKNKHDIQIIDTESASIRSALKGYTVYVTSVAFTPDDKSMVAGYDDGSLIWWNHSSGIANRLIKTEPDKSDPSVISTILPNNDVVVSPDARTYLNMGQLDKTFDSSTGKPLAKIKEPQRTPETSFSGDGRRVAVADDRSIYISDAATGLLVKRIAFPPRKDPGNIRIALGFDGKMVAVCADGLSIRNASTGTVARSFVGARDCEGDLLVSPDGKYLSTTVKGALVTFSTATGKVISKIPEAGWKFAFAPDSKSIASVSIIGSLTVYEIETGKERYSVESAVQGSVNNVAFSHDGKLIAIGTESGAYVLAAADGKLIRAMQ